VKQTVTYMEANSCVAKDLSKIIRIKEILYNCYF